VKCQNFTPFFYTDLGGVNPASVHTGTNWCTAPPDPRVGMSARTRIQTIKHTECVREKLTPMALADNYPPSASPRAWPHGA